MELLHEFNRINKGFVQKCGCLKSPCISIHYNPCRFFDKLRLNALLLFNDSFFNISCMKERTRELFEKNQQLIRELTKIVPHDSLNKKNINRKKNDIVDDFFNRQLKCELSQTPDIVINEFRHKNIKFREEDVIKDIELNYSFIRKAWDTFDHNDLSKVAYGVASQFLPGWIKFCINPEGNIAKGTAGFGNVKQFKAVIEKIMIPIEEQSVLRDVFITGDFFQGALMPNLWNNFISNRLMPKTVCPEVVAIPLFKDESTIKEIILSCALWEDYSVIRINLLKTFTFVMKKVIKDFSYQKVIQGLCR